MIKNLKYIIIGVMGLVVSTITFINNEVYAIYNKNSIYFSELNSYNKELINKYFTRIMDFESQDEKKYRQVELLLSKLVTKYTYNNFNKNALISDKNNNLILYLNKVHYIKYTPNLFGDTSIDLDKEFQKYMLYNNYNLSKILGNNKISRQMLLYYIDTVYKYPNSISCNNTIKLSSLSYLYGIKNDIKIKINDFEVKQNILLCYFKKNINKYVYTYELATYSKTYRIHNISKGLDIISGWWNNGEKLAVGQKLLEADKKHNLYVDGYILKRIKDKETGKYIITDEEKEYGGGLCGVSTLVYQAIINIDGISIIKRRPHSIWYYGLYGKNIGQDATIFWNNKGKATTDLIIQNNTNQDIYLKGYNYFKNKKFITGIKLISFKPLHKRKVIYLGKKGKCGYNKIGNKIIKSCYNDIR